MTAGSARAAPVLHFAIPGDLASPTGGYGYDRALMAELRRMGWQVRHLPLPGGFPFPDAAARAATRAALAALPDGALVMVDGLAFGAMADEAAAEARRLRLVALVHHPLADETGLPAESAAALKASERAALCHARAVICTSPTTAERLRHGFGVAPGALGVAPPGTAPAPALRNVRGKGAVRLLSVGSISRRKGHDVLIAALAGLADLDWRLRIVGHVSDAVLRSSLVAQADDAGIADRVALVGPVADVAAEYADADLFVLATRHEGYGMAFAEALSHGLPVVATAAGPVVDVVPEAAGALVPVDDVAALRAALRRLIANPQARAEAAGAAHAAGRALPDWPETAEQVAAILARVAAQAPQPAPHGAPVDGGAA